MDLDDLELAALVALAGKSPAYVYKRSAINTNIGALRKALPPDVLLHYSLKANPLPQLVSYIAPKVDGMDVASHYELITALGASSNVKTISFSGPGKNDRELLAAVTAGITIHVESAAELRRIADIAEKSGATPRLSVRINPNFTIRQSGMVMGGGAQPFGVDEEQVAAVLASICDYEFKCEGLHCYVGSQILAADIIIDTQTRTLDMMTQLLDKVQLGIEGCTLNIGGGFGIPYFPNERELDITSVGDALAMKLHSVHRNYSNFRVAVETGRYIVGNAGIYIARIIERKQSRGKVFLVVNGGLNHHLAATGNLGQAIRRNFPIKACATRDNEPLETVSVVGPLCTPLDILGSDIELPRLKVGDYLAIRQSGAYGFSASPHGFLGHPAPAELIV